MNVLVFKQLKKKQIINLSWILSLSQHDDTNRSELIKGVCRKLIKKSITKIKLIWSKKLYFKKSNLIKLEIFWGSKY